MTVTQTINDRSVTTMQGAFLGFSIIGTVVMLGYVATLRGKMSTSSNASALNASSGGAMA